MVQKHWIIGVMVFLAVAVAGSGIAALAAAGSKEDPMITQSYVWDEFQPQIVKKITEAVKASSDEYANTLTVQFNNLSASVDSRLNAMSAGNVDTAALIADQAFIDAIAASVVAQLPTGGSSGGGGTAAGVSAGFTYVEVPSGKTVTLERGSEVVVRVGSAKCVASGAVGLVDLSNAEIIENNNELKLNHHYLCTIEGRGFKAGAALKVFIRGPYNVG
ncbi:hypothetical protein FACS18949_04920 [Clostridia bacterium]|nr:hypothetical protein FACS189425_03800 [Clostridia bacterium]GHV32801.1 hypothetical protein FACS18949_04920 [Clostridia bacterium]